MSGWVFMASGALTLLGLALWLAQRLGRIRAERDFHDDTAERAKKAAAIDDRVDRLDDRAVDRRLREFRRE